MLLCVSWRMREGRMYRFALERTKHCLLHSQILLACDRMPLCDRDAWQLADSRQRSFIYQNHNSLCHPGAGEGYSVEDSLIEMNNGAPQDGEAQQAAPSDDPMRTALLSVSQCSHRLQALRMVRVIKRMC